MSAKTRFYELTQVDSWFFRDGRPMHIGESGLAAVQSLFPPPATTVVGAVRAALARANGWSGKGYWKEKAPHVADVLGKSQDLGKVSFSGPFLTRNGQLLYPMPLHLLGVMSGDKWSPRTMLLPGDPVECDLGKAVRLPAIQQCSDLPQGLKNGAGLFLTAKGMEAVLTGKLPEDEDVLAPAELWKAESRIGIRREETRTTGDNGLFSTVHVRLADGVGICLGVDGLPAEWNDPTGLIPLGGEGRLAEIRKLSLVDSLRSLPVDGQRGMGVLLTHADVDADAYLPGGTLPGFACELVCACVEKSQRLGGWCFVAKSPLTVTTLLPAGTVFFFEHEQHDSQQPSSLRIGRRCEYGFGQMALGTWND